MNVTASPTAAYSVGNSPRLPLDMRVDWTGDTGGVGRFLWFHENGAWGKRILWLATWLIVPQLQHSTVPQLQHSVRLVQCARVRMFVFRFSLTDDSWRHTNCGRQTGVWNRTKISTHILHEALCVSATCWRWQTDIRRTVGRSRIVVTNTLRRLRNCVIIYLQFYTVSSNEWKLPKTNTHKFSPEVLVFQRLSLLVKGTCTLGRYPRATQAAKNVPPFPLL
jgi:hypothetical protein